MHQALKNFSSKFKKNYSSAVSNISRIKFFGSKGFNNFIIQETEPYKKQARLVAEGTKLLAFKYPKLIIFTICIILSYLIFQNELFSEIVSHLGVLSYAGTFITGLLFSFGFTTPFATVIFIKMNPENIFLSAIIAGIGALISDLTIFKFVQFSFEEEFKKLRKERPFLFIKSNMNAYIKEKNINYLTLAFAGFLLASPLPDEAGITLLTGMAKMSTKTLAIISFVFKTIGIFILLAI